MEEFVSNEIQMLIKQFHKIAMKRWIKSVNKGLGSIGYTFEQELDKKPDSLYFPDYYGTEVKCTGRYSRYPITLFTSAFDGPTFPEINRIIEKWGYPDKEYKDRNVIFANVDCSNKIMIASGVMFRLDIDYDEEKIYLCVYNSNGELLERESFVYFKTLYDHLYLKLNRLALVYASKKNIDGEVYFRYYRIGVYKIKKFETFLNLLCEGKISVSLIARISKSGVDVGRYRNKNLVFKIRKTDINLLFDEIYNYNYDNCYF